MSKKAGFAGLPAELLKGIRVNLHSLQDVVAFAQVSKITAKLCDEKYWKNAVIAAGFNRPVKSLAQLPKKWAPLARIICADAKRFATYDKPAGNFAWIREEGALPAIGAAPIF